MDFVKAFFLTSGFPTPRMIVNLSEHLILRLMQDAANQDSNNPKIFSPQTIREEIAICEAVLIAKQFVEAERQVDAALSTSNKGDNGFGTLDNTIVCDIELIITAALLVSCVNVPAHLFTALTESVKYTSKC